MRPCLKKVFLSTGLALEADIPGRAEAEVAAAKAAIQRADPDPGGPAPSLVLAAPMH